MTWTIFFQRVDSCSLHLMMGKCTMNTQHSDENWVQLYLRGKLTGASLHIARFYPHPCLQTAQKKIHY